MSEGSAMTEFFKGWRRKIGCVTLAFACVFAAGGVRSYGARDSLVIETSVMDFGFVSNSGTMMIWFDDDVVTYGYVWYTDRPASLDSDEVGIDWDWKWLGFRHFARTRNSVNPDSTAVPYWSIVLPLTLLSAWLLLSKPKPTPVPQSEKAHA
jgi:hypothetical protein